MVSRRGRALHSCGPGAHQPHYRQRVLRTTLWGQLHQASTQQASHSASPVLSHLAISWVKAHTGLSTPEAVGNATARPSSRQRQHWHLWCVGRPTFDPPSSPLRRRSPRGSRTLVGDRSTFIYPRESCAPSILCRHTFTCR